MKAIALMTMLFLPSATLGVSQTPTIEDPCRALTDMIEEYLWEPVLHLRQVFESHNLCPKLCSFLEYCWPIDRSNFHDLFWLALVSLETTTRNFLAQVVGLTDLVKYKASLV